MSVCDSDMSIEEHNLMPYDENECETELYNVYEDQLKLFRKYLVKAYKDWPIPSATVRHVGISDREKYEFVFYDVETNPADRLICVAVKWLQSHYTHINLESDEVYICWFAVRTILMRGFNDVSIQDIEEQYWKHPDIFSRSFVREDRNNRKWYCVKRNLKRIKYLIDMWYDLYNKFSCEYADKDEQYDEYKQYYVKYKMMLPYDIYNLDSYDRQNYDSDYESDDDSYGGID